MLFNYELNRRFHAVHRNGPLKVTKKWRKITITIEYKHKKREKSLLNKKKSPFYRFSQLSKHQILSHPSIYSIYLVFNLIPIRATFLCYRILHFLNKKQERELLQRLVEKHARSPENEPQKAIFTPAERPK